MHHHLPTPDDAALQRAFDALEDAGVDLSPKRRANLSTVHQFGLMDGPDGVGAMLLDAAIAAAPTPAAAAPVDVQAAQDRRMVRAIREDGERPASHRAVFMAAESHPQPERLWRMDADGLGFTHHCGFHEGGFVDSRQTTEMAVAHDKDCEVRDV